MTLSKTPMKLMLALSAFFGGCTAPPPPSVKTLSQDRVILREKGFTRSLTKVEPTLFKRDKKRTSIDEGKSAEERMISAIGTIIPNVIDKGLDIVGNAIISASGDTSNTATIGATASNYFYENTTYNDSLISMGEKYLEFHIVFIRGSFGVSNEDQWQPITLASDQETEFKQLYVQGKPDFYLEAKAFPLAGEEYMEIVPTYMLYNRLLSSKGSDARRDLVLRFSLFDVDAKLDGTPISRAEVFLRDVAYGHEYTLEDFGGTRTGFMKMPSISDTKEGYSGAFTLHVEVMETRDINEWLVALGKSIKESKAEIMKAVPPLSREAKIDLRAKYFKAEKEIEHIEAQIEEEKAKEKPSLEKIQKLEIELITKKAERDKAKLAL